MLAVDPSLLYLLGNPEDPQAVWTKLEEQFQRKTWANKLQLRRKLFSLRLKEVGSVSEHIKSMIEVYEELAVIEEAVQEEDRVVQLIASLPYSYNVLVTALEPQSESIPKWELVTERLLHEETKLQQKSSIKNESRARSKCLVTSCLKLSGKLSVVYRSYFSSGNYRPQTILDQRHTTLYLPGRSGLKIPNIRN